MRSIGERLEEARRRKGISLREAAEATKIRGDFLSSIEQNKFDFDLPEIYKRGFLKNYARYLKLDAEKILADYSAQLLGQSRLGKKAGSEWFGQMELKRDAAPEEQAPATRPEPEPSTAETKGSGAYFGMIRSRPGAEEPADPAENEAESEKTFYLKLGVIVAGSLALAFVLFGLVWAIIGSGDEAAGPATPEPAPLRSSTSPSASEQLSGSGNRPAPTADALTLRASGNVYVLIRQKSDDSELLRRTMSAGETVNVTKSGPVDVLFTAGEFLTIEHQGETLRPSSSGTAKISIP